MELSEVAKNLLTYYNLDWAEDPKLREEKKAIVAVSGTLDDLRMLHYLAMPGEPMMRTLRYEEKDRGSLVLITAKDRPTHFGCEAMPAYHADMKLRLQEIGSLGTELASAHSMLFNDTKRRQRIMRQVAIPGLDNAAQAFIKYIDAHQEYALQAHR